MRVTPVKNLATVSFPDTRVRIRRRTFNGFLRHMIWEGRIESAAATVQIEFRSSAWLVSGVSFYSRLFSHVPMLLRSLLPWSGECCATRRG